LPAADRTALSDGNDCRIAAPPLEQWVSEADREAVAEPVSPGVPGAGPPASAGALVDVPSSGSACHEGPSPHDCVASPVSSPSSSNGGASSSDGDGSDWGEELWLSDSQGNPVLHRQRRRPATSTGLGSSRRDYRQALAQFRADVGPVPESNIWTPADRRRGTAMCVAETASRPVQMTNYRNCGDCGVPFYRPQLSECRNCSKHVCWGCKLMHPCWATAGQRSGDERCWNLQRRYR
jgi:hypothetical protein